MKKELPTHASFLVTENCNLACTYCFENKRRNARVMTEDVAIRGVDLLVENAVKCNSPTIGVMLFGGEPLLETSLCDLILEHALLKAHPYRIQVVASIVTNATIWNPGVEYLLDKYKQILSCQLSVDGDAETQDRYRVTKSGAGTFDLVAANVPKFVEAYKEFPQNLNIHGCVNKESLPKMYHNYTLFKYGWGIDRIWFLPVHGETWGEADPHMYLDQLRLIKNDVLKQAKELKDPQQLYTYAPLDKGFNNRCGFTKPCGAGQSFMTITADGMLYPCHHFYFNDYSMETCIGHVSSGINEDRQLMYLSYDHNDTSCNKDCSATACYRCIADNWVINGSILTQVKGLICKMSLAEKIVQDEFKKEAETMGLLNREDNVPMGPGNNPNNPACYCDINANDALPSETRGRTDGGSQHVCKCAGTQPELDIESLMLILAKMNDRLDKLDNRVGFIIKEIM